ncbi:hypothetical protein [Hansschlegelia plantiphila]|uniref:Uncharacterized protein n=1 Tax=Hansschlegelia plantiphila TaxID=374655 RepID=A0A9W6IZ83_9HYPH|nr:hypothetical protein [Hansschlegelia plantiphila]GLK67757.1 hypothetical protein GCM10008179_13950 [Hansschlegelia plantiphila]
MSINHRASALLGVAASVLGGAAFAVAAPADVPSAPGAEQATALVSDGVQPKAESDPTCPKIVVEPDGGVFPRRDDAYKATVEGIARDCADLGAETILKVAVVGEGERDSKDGPSWFNAPLRLAVKDAEGKPVETRKMKVRVQLPTGVQKVSFNHLEENVSLPPVEGGYANWTVVVGFDPSGGGAERPAKAVRRQAPRRAAARVRAPAPLPPVATGAAAVIRPAAEPVASTTMFQKLAADRTARQIRAREAQSQKARQQQLAARVPQARPAVAPRPQSASPQPPARVRTASE